jgi:uncharacterized protein (DUF697 family)
MTEKEAHANEIVSHYMWWSAGAGLIPVPLLDMAAVTGVQIKMLSRLAKLYDTSFSEHQGKSIISALLGSIVPSNLARGALGSMIKAVPVVGSIAGLITMPAFSGAATYAIGKVFIQHFEAGGTLLDFDPEKMKAYFAAKYKEGQGMHPPIRPASSSTGSSAGSSTAGSSSHTG